MATVTLDTITYAAMRDAFVDAPQGRPVNRGYVSIDLDDEEIAALQSEQIDGETLPETIMRVSTSIRKAA